MVRIQIILILILCFVAEPLLAASRQPLIAQHAAVASVSIIASRIGSDVMKKGGNAVDAAVAVGLALAVVWPSAGNLGGGGFMVIRMKDGTAVAIDYRERAPAAAFREMYQDSAGNVIPGLSTLGYKAVGVPGTVAGLVLASKNYGKLPWKDLVEPAYELAKNGFIVSDVVSQYLQERKEELAQFESTRKVYFVNGNGPAAGSRFIQPDLAATLARLRDTDGRDFYEGKTAHLMAEDLKAHGGLITLEDLKNYKAVVRKPVEGTYRGYRIISMPPPSSGGAALIEMLNMVEKFSVSDLGFHSADQINLFTEAMRRAFADRAKYMGDPDFVTVPTERLISKEYGALLANDINLEKSTSSDKIQSMESIAPESKETTHYSIIDAEGNAVANTYTLNDSYGAKVVAAGTGFLLNNEMDDFTSKPGVPNLYKLIQGEANAVQPGKRPLSAMTPTIVLKNDQPFLIIGSPGGSTIINTVFEVATNVIDFGMNIQEAVDAPRFHHQWMPDLLFTEPFAINKDTQKVLEQRGNKFSQEPFFAPDPYWGDAQGILIDPKTGIRSAASDPRRGGEPAGY
ncbi:MAG: gamma-glutamyltransferase [Acidobacteria bacterium]|nr:MAG: gamma-glutamyltransferase [Acidobacteriota bacterium]